MKKNDLIRVIREIVRQEIKKELPNALAQCFSQLMGGQKSQPKDVVGKEVDHAPSATEMPEEVDETASLKMQLAEMFNSGAPVKRVQQPVQQKKFSSNPVLNEVLNQTRPFNGMERMAMGGGGIGMSPAVMMASSGFESPQMPTTGVGQLMESDELSFLKKIPGMPGADDPVVTSIPAGHGGGMPMADMGMVSALDLKNHPALPDSIKSVLTRDYRSLVKAMDKKKPK